MLASFSEVEGLLRTPGRDRRPLRIVRRDGVVESVSSSADALTTFPVVAGQPILVDFHDSVARPAWFAPSSSGSYSAVPRRTNALRLIKGAVVGTAAISRANLRLFRQQLPAASPVVLMIGGATQGNGTEPLYADPTVRLMSFDIYPSPLTHFVADAHSIPLDDACVDGVCIQAVLEHVLEPQAVVAEIFRILKPGGVVYAETPFMQQVHEGAYDFTRFTELGHRWLWKKFAEIKRGAMGGPGLSLYWSIRYYLRAMTGSSTAGDALSAPFMLLALSDRFIKPSRLIEGANGVFFLGRKAEDALTVNEVIAQYLGHR